MIDGHDKVMVVMRRVRGRWAASRVERPALYRTRLLGGLEFSIGVVFRAAGLM